MGEELLEMRVVIKLPMWVPNAKEKKEKEAAQNSQDRKYSLVRTLFGKS